MIIYKKNLEGFNNTLSYRLIVEILENVITSNYEIIPMKETNEILKILILNISEISELNINNNFYFNETILNLIVIYSNYKNNYFNFENFNKKIIPIIYRILDKEIIEYINNIHNSTKRILTECISIFSDFTENNNFFLNLEKNEKLKKFFINIINKYIDFLIIDDNHINHYEVLLNNFFDFYVLENIKNNDSCKKIYFEIIDCFLAHFIEILNSKTLTEKNFDAIKFFLVDILFKNPLYLENITNLDTLINILKKIIDIELYNNEKEVNRLSIYTIQIYTKYIATIPKENNEKICKFLEIFEENIEKLLIFIKSQDISIKNFMYNHYSYYEINNFLYCSNIHFENNKFNIPYLLIKIENTFYDHILKIIMFELDNINYKVTNFHKNFAIYNFISKNTIELEKYFFKNKISNKVIKILEKFYKSPEDQESSENINFTTKDTNFLEFAFLYEFIDINNLETTNLLLQFLENYKSNFSKSVNNVKYFELYIVLNHYITNLVNKLNMNEILKNNFLENVNKLALGTEIQEFICNEDGKEFKKLFIVKLINAIKESDLKILEKLEKLNEEIFINFMINFIDNFKKLDNFYCKKNNNREFRKTVYNDFMKIFYIKMGKTFSKDFKNNEITFYWSVTEIRKRIITHLNSNNRFNSNKKKQIK